MTEKQIPCDKCPDSTFMLLREGYLFISNRTGQYASDLFKTRILGKPAVCMSGKQAAKLFYNTEFFRRRGALPKRIQKTLFGVSAIQTMDGQKHMHRKCLFKSVLHKEYQDRLLKITAKEWECAAAGWERKKQVVLFDEVNRILCRAVCEWAQIPLMPEEEKYRARNFSEMVSSFGSVGREYRKGKRARKQTEQWLQRSIEAVRCGNLRPEKDAVLYKTAFYREGGRLLDAAMAAIELINILRPIIAVSRFIVFTALALEENRGLREKLLKEEEAYYERFVQEVRRYYPFAPCLGAIVRRNFRWNGYLFKKGTLVLLDLYGTNHDPRIWEEPDQFRPERFCGKREHVFDFIPQGGGDASRGHRCPGEGMTIELMKQSLDFLVHRLEYEVPAQNLSFSLRKIPSLPQSGFIMKDIRLKDGK